MIDEDEDDDIPMPTTWSELRAMGGPMTLVDAERVNEGERQIEILLISTGELERDREGPAERPGESVFERSFERTFLLVIHASQDLR
jgi:hypothetical protein